jgi:proline iminopeptidase
MKNRFRIFIFVQVLFGAILLTSCHQEKEIQTGEGFINVDGGKVWYQVVGHGNKTPILVLHGGPGVPGYYLKPLEALGTDRKVIFYDQLGCGRSDHSTDTTKMTVDHFVEELRTVIQHFGLKEFYLYGQSWGTMLGTDYYLKYPEGIKAIILSSPAISIPMWLRDADTLLSTLPDSIQNTIRINEQRKSYNSPGYLQAVQVYYQHFLARKLPWSPDIDSAFAQVGESYMYMWGPSEFTALGQLKTYDRSNRLGEIKVPTLFIAGEFDEARPSTVKYYQSLVPGAKFEVIKGAAHLTAQDKPEENNRVVIDFINSLEVK